MRLWTVPVLVSAGAWSLAACVASYAQGSSPEIGTSDLFAQAVVSLLVWLGVPGGLVGMLAWCCRVVLRGKPMGFRLFVEDREIVFELRPVAKAITDRAGSPTG